jgi:hypothetical protein
LNTGNYMLPHCKALIGAKPPRFWEGQCAGVIDTWLYFGALLPENERFCPPKIIPPSQAQRVVVRWLEKHSEKLHLNFIGLVWEALRESWPCLSK